MEFFTILLSSLLALASPVGIVVDTVAENTLRSQLDEAEQLQVRVDNTPNYQLVKGKIDRVRVAGRGLWLTQDIRIAVFEVETDPVNLSLQRLSQGEQDSPQEALNQPLQAAFRLALTEEDLNRALQSSTVTEQIEPLLNRLAPGAASSFEFLNPQIELLSDNRIRLRVDLRSGNEPPLAVTAESGLEVVSGHRFRLIEPEVVLNQTPLPPQFVNGLARRLSENLSLRNLQSIGITARLLQLEIDATQLQVIAFVRVEPPR